MDSKAVREVRVQPLSRPPERLIEMPGSKSLTNRALLCAGLAQGESTIDGLLRANDSRAMPDCVEKLGAVVKLNESTAVVH